MNKQEEMERTSRGKLHATLTLFFLESSMKPHSIFSGAVRLLALLIVSAGLTMGLNGSVGAQEGMQGHDHDKSGTKPQSASSGKKQLPCGGPSVIKCPVGMSCVDDPHDKCDPTKDGLNCPGMCVAGGTGEEQKVKQPCGGPSRIGCQGGMICVDDPSDNCDPTRDGLDCKGMCVSR